MKDYSRTPPFKYGVYLIAYGVLRTKFGMAEYAICELHDSGAAIFHHPEVDEVTHAGGYDGLYLPSLFALKGQRRRTSGARDTNLCLQD
jgi:hypothetical protein